MEKKLANKFGTWSALLKSMKYISPKPSTVVKKPLATNNCLLLRHGVQM